MKSTIRLSIVVGLLCGVVLISRAQSQRGRAAAQSHKPIYITRMYTGPDGLSHTEEIEAKPDPTGRGNVIKLEQISGAEIHRSTPGTVLDWHTGPRRQYVITLSGQGELEVAGGKIIPDGPGHIVLVEDTTDKGHITRTTGTEEKVSLWLPIVDQAGK